MEVVETRKERKCVSNQENRPTNSKCKKRYVQPPRVKPFKPPTTFCTPKTPIESRTTYHSSFDKEEVCKVRPKPILPIHNITLNDDKFSNDTTNKLSFQPVWGLYKPKAIMPRQRLCFRGPLEKVTTNQQSYVPKIMPKAEPILPCGHIRTSNAMFEGKTTTLLSYINPGPVEPVKNFRPNLKYCPPTEHVAQETTQKLSYLPYQVGKKENYPWARKPIYKRPEISMNSDTTYTKSFFENNCPKEKPILPRDTCVFPSDGQYPKSTIYKDSFVPCNIETVSPILPCPNIFPSDQKMFSDTTSKLSFQPVKGEKRKPIVPRSRKILGDVEFTNNITTNQLSYTPKIMKRTPMILPCGHIRTADGPIDGTTTTALSYVTPGPVEQYPNFRPLLKYCKPEQKIEGETVNKLSYQQWSIGPKEEYPWARKKCYQRPSDKIATDTIYHMSFPAPGYYVDECKSEQELPTSSIDCGDH